MSSPEGKLRDKCIDWCKTQSNIWFIKIWGNAVQSGGCPDFILCVNGRFVAPELKRPDGTGELSARQKLVIKQIIRAGGITGEVKSLEEFIELVNRCK